MLVFGLPMLTSNPSFALQSFTIFGPPLFKIFSIFPIFFGQISEGVTYPVIIAAKSV